MEGSMKKATLILNFALMVLLVLSVATTMAQLNPGPPPPPVSGPEAGTYVATPIGGGILVLMSMIGYGVYRLRRND
jgi:hypothetical protein